MKLILGVIITLGLAYAGDEPAKMTETQALKLDVEGLKQQIAQLHKEIASRDQRIADLEIQVQQSNVNSLVTDICGDKKIPVAECQINPAEKTVVSTKPKADNSTNKDKKKEVQ